MTSVPNTPPSAWNQFIRVPYQITENFKDLDSLLNFVEPPSYRHLDDFLFEYKGTRYKFIRIEDEEEHEYGWAIVRWNQ